MAINNMPRAIVFFICFIRQALCSNSRSCDRHSRREKLANALHWPVGTMIVVVSWTSCALASATSPATLDGLSAFSQGEYAEAIHDWQAAAAQGDGFGALYIGVMYDTGAGVGQNYVQALHWYEQSASLGNAAAAFNVGVMYDVGRGSAPDTKNAALWYGKASRLGYARADYNLGLLYEGGIGVRQDLRQAHVLFRAAAALGVSAAAQHLHASRKRPTLQPQREQDDVMRDFIRAQTLLLDRSPANMSAAALLFRRSADLHNPMAEYDLGFCYQNGIGVEHNEMHAYEWFSRAAVDAQDRELSTIARDAQRTTISRLTAGQRATLDNVGAASGDQASP